MRVLVFGDSIAQGFFDLEGGWVDRLRRHFDEVLIRTQDLSQPTIFNLGISGDTTKAVLNRFENEVIARQWPGEEYAIVFATGTNDTIFRGIENDLEPSQFKELLTELHKASLKYTNKIAFVGLLPVVDDKLNPMPWSKSGKCYSTERISLFNDELKRFCDDKKVLFIDLFDRFDPESLTFDGIHPNDAGHKMIANSVTPKLEALIA